jgi:hypothetical protein
MGSAMAQGQPKEDALGVRIGIGSPLSREVGEEEEHDPEGCANWVLMGALARLSEWELFCIDWYYSNVNSFTLECGLIARGFGKLRLDDLSERLFFRALNSIHTIESKIRDEKM